MGRMVEAPSMKCSAAVVGAGRQGLCAAYDLARLPAVGRVTLVDADEERLALAVDRLHGLAPNVDIAYAAADAKDPDALASALSDARVVVSSVPFFLGYGVCEAAVRAGAHVVDLGGNLEESARIHGLGARAAERHVVVAPDCGLAPGLANVLAAEAIARLEREGARDVEVEIRCGGLPRAPRNALRYELVFSFDGLLNEYDGASQVIRAGARAEEPALEEIELWSHPKLGPLECAATSGGTSTAPDTFLGRVRGYRYRTVRYPGHFAFFLTLKQLGLLAPRHRPALRALLEPALATEEPDDLALLRVDASSSTGHAASLELLDARDAATGFTAMERATAFPAVVVLELALEGRLRPGALRLERDLPLADTIDRLARRGLVAGPPAS